MNLIAYGLIALAMLWALGGLGYKVRESGKESVRLEWAKANEEAREREAAASAKAAADLAAERAKRKVVIRERTTYVDREIEKLVTMDSCIKPEGVKLINETISKSGD